MNEQELNECLWQEIISRAGKRYETHKGNVFTYHIREDRSGETSGELVIDGKMTKITRSTILLAYHRTRELQEKHGCVIKPGKIGVYGDVWLYPVFLDIGICTRSKEEKARPFVTKVTQEIKAEGEAKAEASTEAVREPAGEMVKTCARCGYTTTEDFDFCPKCGNPLL